MARKNGTLKVTDALADMMRRTPFNEFDIKMADGDTIHVEHPDYIARSPFGDMASFTNATVIFAGFSSIGL